MEVKSQWLPVKELREEIGGPVAKVDCEPFTFPGYTRIGDTSDFLINFSPSIFIQGSIHVGGFEFLIMGGRVGS
jgi:hypothetical protein